MHGFSSNCTCGKLSNHNVIHLQRLRVATRLQFGNIYTPREDCEYSVPGSIGTGHASAVADSDFAKVQLRIS